MLSENKPIKQPNKLQILTPGQTADRRLDNLSQDHVWFLSQFFTIINRYWLEPRPIMMLHNQDQQLSSQLTRGEIQEAQAEHLFEGALINHGQELQKEVLDIFVLATSLFNNLKTLENLNLAELAYFNHQELIRLGQSNHVYERLDHLVSVLAEAEDWRLAQELKANLLSLVINLPVDFEPREILQAVLIKNNRNYPAAYFQIFDPILKRDLTELEQTQKYVHLKKALAILRYDYEQDLIDLHSQFAFLIHNFKHSETSLERLRLELDTSHLRQAGKDSTEEKFELNPGEEYSVVTLESGLVKAQKK